MYFIPRSVDIDVFEYGKIKETDDRLICFAENSDKKIIFQYVLNYTYELEVIYFNIDELIKIQQPIEIQCFLSKDPKKYIILPIEYTKIYDLIETVQEICSKFHECPFKINKKFNKFAIYELVKAGIVDIEGWKKY